MNEYILQCEKAIELQKIGKNEYYCSNKPASDEWHFIEDESTPIEEDGFHSGKWIWIPAQNTLQEILGCIGVRPRKIIEDLYKFSGSLDFSKKYSVKTMDQLWLAFAMKEKFNKLWNGTKWIIKGKENDRSKNK